MALFYKSIQQSKLRPSKWHKLRESKCFAIFGYVLAITIIGFVTLYPLPANKNPVAWSNLHNSLFISLSRPAFIGALVLLMVLMALGHGRLLRNFFSMPFWVPFSRLSYLVYLTFPLINATVISQMSQALFLSYYTMFYLLAFAFAFSMVAGFFIHIFVEAPLMNLILGQHLRHKEGDRRIQTSFDVIKEH